jgi:ribose transport system substrate-binding protein
MEDHMNLSRKRRITAGTACLIGVAILATACSSSSKTNTDTKTSTAPASSAATTAAPSPIGSATGALSDLNLPIRTPLKVKPATGKRAIFLQCTVDPSCQTIGAGATEAGKLLGWDVTSLAFGVTPTAQNDALLQAVSQKPDIIFSQGSPSSVLQTGLAAACQANIPVITGQVVDTISGPCSSGGNGLVGDNASEKNDSRVAAAVADEIASKSQDAHVIAVNIPQYPTLGVRIKAFTAELTAKCPSCTVKTLNQQATDVLKNTPANVVSAIQSAPSTNYLYFTTGSLSLGVESALQAAKFGKVVITGSNADGENLEAMKAGTPEVWGQWSLTLCGFEFVDLAARWFESPTVLPEAVLPFDLLTTANPTSTIPDIPTDFRDQYKKLWLVS